MYDDRVAEEEEGEEEEEERGEEQSDNKEQDEVKAQAERDEEDESACLARVCCSQAVAFRGACFPREQTLVFSLTLLFSLPELLSLLLLTDLNGKSPNADRVLIGLENSALKSRSAEMNCFCCGNSSTVLAGLALEVLPLVDFECSLAVDFAAKVDLAWVTLAPGCFGRGMEKLKGKCLV